MWSILFFLAVAGCAFAGFKKGTAESGYIFISAGMATYFPVWLLPFSLQITEHIPEEYQMYVLPAVLIIPFIIILLTVKALLKMLIDQYPVLNSDPTISEMPVLNKVGGAIFGAYSGYAALSFLMFFITFIPFDQSEIIGDDFAKKADSGILSFSRTVNKFAADSWNSKQQEYLETVTKKFRNIAGQEQTEKQPAEAEAKAEETSPAAEKAGNQTPAASKAGNQIPAAEKFAKKAVQAAETNQKRAAEAAEAAQNETPKPELPKAVPAAVEKPAGPAESGKKDAAAVPPKAPERKAVSFRYTVSKLYSDGRESQFKSVLTLKINLPEDGKLPIMIDAEVPIPVLREKKRTITQTVRIDLTLQELTSIPALPEQEATKYTIVNVE